MSKPIIFLLDVDATLIIQDPYTIVGQARQYNAIHKKYYNMALINALRGVAKQQLVKGVILFTKYDAVSALEGYEDLYQVAKHKKLWLQSSIWNHTVGDSRARLIPFLNELDLKVLGIITPGDINHFNLFENKGICCFAGPNNLKLSNTHYEKIIRPLESAAEKRISCNWLNENWLDSKLDVARAAQQAQTRTVTGSTSCESNEDTRPLLTNGEDIYADDNNSHTGGDATIDKLKGGMFNTLIANIHQQAQLDTNFLAMHEFIYIDDNNNSLATVKEQNNKSSNPTRIDLRTVDALDSYGKSKSTQQYLFEMGVNLWNYNLSNSF
tara:strand:+ start:19070 stop:20044 length:975 start_codon:yes stop_codon:yes gene_type:complete